MCQFLVFDFTLNWNVTLTILEIIHRPVQRYDNYITFYFTFVTMVKLFS
jgi:hypothetical protein